MKSTSIDSINKKQMSNDFRETLLKSGIDASTLQPEESATGNTSDDKFGFSAPENDDNTRTPSESAEKEKQTSPKRWRYSHLLAIAAIILIIVLQFAFQFSLLQDESLRVAENLIKERPSEKQITESAPEAITSQTEEIAKIKSETEQKAGAAKTAVEPKKSMLKNQRESRVFSGKLTNRKKESRETTAERLRRAERILTGV